MARQARSAFQRGAIPVGEGRARRVGGAGEVEQRGVRVGGGAYRLVGQDELAQRRVVDGGGGLHGGGGEPLRRGGHVRVICGLGDRTIGRAGPEAATADLVRVRL